MKKTLFILASIAAIFVGCAKVENDTTAEPSTKTITLKVRADDITTKATYSSTTGQFTWAAGDQIGVHAWVTENTSDTWPQPMTLKSGLGSPEGVFEIQGFDSKNSYGTVAFYPWNGWDDKSDDENGTNLGGDGKLYVHLKPTVSYANSSANPMHVLPLAAQISNGQTEGIQFKHLGAGVMVTINDVPAKANKVSLTIPGKNITGWYTIEPENIGTTALVATGGNNSTVSITFDPAADKRNMTFVFPMPTVSFSSMTLKMYQGSSTEIWSKTASSLSAQTLQAGDILNMPELTVLGYEDPDIYYLAGYIDGEDVWVGKDALKFNNGKLSITAPSDKDDYVIIVDGTNKRYTFESYVDYNAAGASGILYARDGDWTLEKMKIASGKTVEFTLAHAGYSEDGHHMLSLSYVVK